MLREEREDKGRARKSFLWTSRNYILCQVVCMCYTCSLFLSDIYVILLLYSIHIIYYIVCMYN
jgi:hypothetical protein